MLAEWDEDMMVATNMYQDMTGRDAETFERLRLEHNDEVAAHAVNTISELTDDEVRYLYAQRKSPQKSD